MPVAIWITHAKRQIIADELKENPGRSNNWIAKSLGVDDKTVASVRREMQSTSEIPKLGYTLGSDGKYRPATRVACRRTGMADSLMSFPVLEIVSTSTSTMKKASSRLRLRSGSGGSQRGSRRSRRGGNNHALSESRNVAVPSFTAIALT